MELLLKADMQTYTPFAAATPDAFFNPTRQQLVDSIGGLISDEALTAILAFTRDDVTDEATALYKFWLAYVLPYSVLSVFVEMSATHGYTFSTNGIIQFADRDNTSAGVDEKSRGMFIRQYTTQRERYKTLMQRAFNDVSGVFDSTTYTINTEKYNTVKPAPVFTAIGRVNTERDLSSKFRL